MDPDATHVVVNLEPILPGIDVMKIGITRGYESEFKDLLAANEISARDVLELSAAGELYVLGVSFITAAGGLTALAAVLNAFFKRNSTKKVSIYYPGGNIELTGLSERETRQALTDAVGTIEQRSAYLQTRWTQFKELTEGAQFEGEVPSSGESNGSTS